MPGATLPSAHLAALRPRATPAPRAQGTPGSRALQLLVHHKPDPVRGEATMRRNSIMHWICKRGTRLAVQQNILLLFPFSHSLAVVPVCIAFPCVRVARSRSCSRSQYLIPRPFLFPTLLPFWVSLCMPNLYAVLCSVAEPEPGLQSMAPESRNDSRLRAVERVDLGPRGSSKSATISPPPSVFGLCTNEG